MAKIAVLLHSTFTRWDYLMKTVFSFCDNSNFKIYLSYTGELDLKKIGDMNNLENYGHECYYMGWDTSPAITRNFLIDRITEPYIWKVDDDFLFDKGMDYEKIIKLLESRKDLGLVGMSVYSKKYVSPFIYRAEIDNNVLKLNQVKKFEKELDGLRYAECDLTPDCWIAKKEIFPECNYDEQYHVCQGLHTDFFMHIKYNTNWKVAYTPDVKMYTFKHDKGWDISKDRMRNSFYGKKRFRSLDLPLQGKEVVFLPKWKLKNVNKW